eukprot:1455653-Alexandrium_andersonii.AAC.1
MCTGAVRGFFKAATHSRMVELGHAGRWRTLDRGADARPIVPLHPAAASTEARLPAGYDADVQEELLELLLLAALGPGGG